MKWEWHCCCYREGKQTREGGGKVKVECLAACTRKERERDEMTMRLRGSDCEDVEGNLKWIIYDVRKHGKRMKVKGGGVSSRMLLHAMSSWMILHIELFYLIWFFKKKNEKFALEIEKFSEFCHLGKIMSSW